jgi:putative ABC transport system substrate-binding protein
VASSLPIAEAVLRGRHALPLIALTTLSPDVASRRLASLPRPGQFALISSFAQVEAKRLEVLADLLPNLSRLAVLKDHNDLTVESRIVRLAEGAEKLGITLRIVSVGAVEELPSALASQAPDAQAVYVPHSALVSAAPDEIIEALNALRLPAIFEHHSLVRRGGFLSYGPVDVSFHKEVATALCAFRAGSTSVPTQLPKVFSVYLNARTAASLGLRVSKRALHRVVLVHP